MMSTFIRNTLAAAVLGGTALVGPAAFAQDTSCPKPPPQSSCCAKQAAQAHLEAAQSYEQQAARYEEQAKSERDAAADYDRWLPASRSGVVNPKAEKVAEEKTRAWEETQQKAEEAQAMADYHTMRAHELSRG
jgi:hypothetical protein